MHCAPVPILVFGGALTGMNWVTNLRRRCARWRSGKLHARRSNSNVRTSVLILVIALAVLAREEAIVAFSMSYPLRMSAFGMPPRGPPLHSAQLHSVSSYHPRDDRPLSHCHLPCILAHLPSHSLS